MIISALKSSQNVLLLFCFCFFLPPPNLPSTAERLLTGTLNQIALLIMMLCEGKELYYLFVHFEGFVFRQVYSVSFKLHPHTFQACHNNGRP